MKLKLLATGDGPDHYSSNGEIITAHRNGQSESFDLSQLNTGDLFQGITVDTLTLNPNHIIRDAWRDSNNELHVKLCQPVGHGDWSESYWIDVENYDANKAYVVLTNARLDPNKTYEPVWNSNKNEWIPGEKE